MSYNNMNWKTIKKMQDEYGYTQLQDLINNGTAWLMEGSVGRTAMSALQSGACMLPKKVYYDAYGSKVPSRDMLKEGSTGTYQNTVKFYSEITEYVEL
ncbi:MAG: hypothetical protein EBR34_15755 [Sphingomonadaceae bacterium]|nr:hypothetical protein [Sphingomonadaceae bacterium]